jgi:hypothetical protein
MRFTLICVDPGVLWDLVRLRPRFPWARTWIIYITRFFLIAEFAWCVHCERTWLWVGQFILTTWWNLFLIVSSHDFEESESKADRSPGQDWGVY